MENSALARKEFEFLIDRSINYSLITFLKCCVVSHTAKFFAHKKYIIFFMIIEIIYIFHDNMYGNSKRFIYKLDKLCMCNL